MADEGDGLERTVFIVRLDRDRLGRITGVIERVRTGEKARVGSLDELGASLAALWGGEDAESPPES
jgi:hypothetical protein